MDPNLRLAWTKIVTPDDYDRHMAAIGQAQAIASLTRFFIESSCLPKNARVFIVGAGTGQMLEYLDPSVLSPFQLTCTDLNETFLSRLKQRLSERSLTATLVVDDLEQSALRPGPHLLLAALVLEHIDWLRGVDTFRSLYPKACGIIIQENPPDMDSAVTPGRPLPASIAKAIEIARPTLISRAELIRTLERAGFECRSIRAEEVADGKRLIGLMFAPRTPQST